MNTYKCIIVDDDEVARLKAISVVRQFPMLKVLGVYASAKAAFAAVENEKPDILLLDIDMPSMSGLELRKQLHEIPVCVFITSHPEHAAESFELETLDFIVKPLTAERFSLTVKRLEEFLEIRQKAQLFESSFGDDFIYIKDGYEKVKLKLFEVDYLEALKDYTILSTAKKRHCVLASIGNLLKENHFESFVRIHRSYAVPKHRVERIGNTEIELVNGVKLPVGNSFKQNLSQL